MSKAPAGAPPPLPTRSFSPTKAKPSSAKSPSKHDKDSTGKEFTDIVDGLKSIYKNKIRPLEQAYSFEQFHSPYLTDADIEAKPIVLLIGGYSTGKSTFVKHILDKEYPGLHIGPEPTTDRFVAVMGGAEERIIPGNAAAVSAEMPWTSIQRFGSQFLQKFQVSFVNSPVLENLIVVDTPGILSGEKQRIGRSYDFTGVVEWFAGRADLILLLFDAHKLDISDEFKNAIMALKGNDEKIRVVLNKADMVTGQQLMRVYGALMWSLGKVLQTPEVMRVYIGSFWDQPLQHSDSAALLTAEQQDLLKDLRLLPKNAIVRKINEIVKRTRMARVHALIIAHLRKEMPSVFGRKDKQDELLSNLPGEFTKLERMHGLTPGDFPDPDRFRETLQMFKLEKFPKLDRKMMQTVEDALANDFPKLMAEYPSAQPTIAALERNPFENPGESTSGQVDEIWRYDMIDRRPYVEQFKGIVGIDGKASGATCKPMLEGTGVDKAALAKIWRLADWTKDGYLDLDEFIVAMHLCNVLKKQWAAELPDILPPTLIPTRKI
ncbi:P-loop containing nucleoside triphosphate hydrolase protein [Fimicolochytrium jonesii]|uniref:P-loop containing nucleoside triphosphate hydrolase protein n=1 Tax=Fimicolochytrium jonesii TaxID=1396493 RepID=UPI0022FDE64A|nr:P-loop containing nucleoside triphosphate hydrolase protein [Fimicolochytrium jonesii]KAI8815637.1 P-loop containing nucleoside triphosphate hydrolase protein [Fimicolochytrium jonesii]